ncbi:hypothetical protein BDFB_015212 [Asbolus verrucosus]|uniref:Uncharacterized protein n=1 Tax=Asbolus verrucosus TaxID=1661398 RepID=A0A482VIT8_ASBVE|nr:hypothetical protein BDFB_015212 [Asbolus verrucosus]
MEMFDDRIIDRNTAIPCPPKSCDLTPCDFFLWPYIKNSIYTTLVNNLEKLRHHITNKIEEINNTLNILESVINSFKRRVLKCFQEEGGHFQHLL